MNEEAGDFAIAKGDIVVGFDRAAGEVPGDTHAKENSSVGDVGAPYFKRWAIFQGRLFDPRANCFPSNVISLLVMNERIKREAIARVVDAIMVGCIEISRHDFRRCPHGV